MNQTHTANLEAKAMQSDSAARLRGFGPPGAALLKTVALALGLSGSGSLHAYADDLFQLSWRGRIYLQSESGKVVTARLTEQDFIRKVAVDNGISDPRSLVFVYRPNKHDTAVVWKANGGFVADVIQMEDQFTEVVNANQTMVVRQAMLSDEYHSGALGSAFGTERARRNTQGELTSYRFSGSFQYALSDLGAVCSGTFSTGRRIKDTSGE